MVYGYVQMALGVLLRKRYSEWVFWKAVKLLKIKSHMSDFWEITLV